ncbi:MAG TPA: MarR family transcriptional regulator [Firmicutes bacterium]|nr:MarR family transcriptional regulator [Bacillota bacterium]
MSYANLFDMQRCACGNIRKTARIITQFYDQYIQPTGLRSSQCSLLFNISLHGNASISELGTLLLMDQTTVTRNIEILRKQKYITVEKEENDARVKLISITKSGRDKLAEAVPLWAQAQLEIEKGLGVEQYQEFLKMLRKIEQLAE